MSLTDVVLMPGADYQAICDAIRAKNGVENLYKSGEISAAIHAISGLNEAVTEFQQQNEKVTQYMASAEVYTDNDFSSVTVANDYKDSTQTTWERPEGVALTIAEDGTVYITDEETGNGWSEAVTKGTHTLKNVIPGNWYTCVIRNINGIVTGLARIKGTGQVRMIHVPNSVHNFRDIGGWPCDGGIVKYGMIYRGAQLSYYSSGGDAVYSLIDSIGIHYLRDICKIRCEIDLRTDAQVIGISSSPIGDDVEYIHYPYSDASYTDIINPAGSYAGQTKDMITKIMQNIASGIPTYIHCQAGADRTGTICMVLEALLGVSGRDCDKDYELTTFYYQGSYYRPRTDSNWVALRNYISRLSGDTLLDKAVSWCKLMGIQASLINCYRRAMINGSPKNVGYSNSVTYNLTNVSSDNTTNAASNGGSYTAVLSVSIGFTLASVIVTMGGVDITAVAYDNSTGAVTIPEVTGDIVITANAVANAWSVRYALTNAVSSNTATIINDGDSYNTTISASSGYILSSVIVTMGATDITDSAYNADTGIVSIYSVTGDVVITAVAVVSRTDVLRQSVASDGSLYNDGTGYKSGYRLNSGGNESAASGVYCSGFIPMANTQTIEFEGIELPAVSGVGNSYYTIHFYDNTFTRIAKNQYQAHNVFLTPSIGSGTKDDSGDYIKTFKPTGVPGLAYIRFSCGLIDDNSNVYVYDS